MKKAYLYILALLMTGSWMASCDETEPSFYDVDSDGVYFDYDTPEAFRDTINFAEYFGTENEEEVPMTIKLRLMGYLADHDRKLVFKSVPVENFPQAEVRLPEVVFAAGEYEKEIEITVMRPQATDILYAAAIGVDESLSEIGTGAEEYSQFTLYVEEKYTTPNDWNYGAGMFFGAFTPEKHRFIIEVTEDPKYTSKDPWSGTLAQYNLAVVDSIRTHNQAHPDEKIPFGIPFYYEIHDYPRPYYWNEQHDKYLGTYVSDVFTGICNANNVTTLDEEEFFAGDEDKMKQLNKQAAMTAMQGYNNRYYWFMSGEQLKNFMYIPMFKDTDYDVIRPDWWQNYNPTGAEIEKYYGEYSDAKYKFMIKTWLDHKGEKDFFLMQLFPLIAQGSESFVWDDTMGGEAGIKECYKVIKAEYDKNPDQYEFTFPEIKVD